MEQTEHPELNSCCKNCNANLQEGHAFCPSCGQETKDKIVSFKSLFLEFLGDFFTFDSKFFRSLFPFVFRPGAMTRDFIEGRRVRFIPPLRILIFTSLLYGVVLGQISRGTDWKGGSDSGIVKFGGDSIDSIEASDSSVVVLGDELPIVNVVDSIRQLVAANNVEAGRDSAAISGGEGRFSINMDTEEWMRAFTKYADAGVQPDSIADLMVNMDSYILKKGVTQFAKIYSSGGEDFVGFAISNLTVILLLALPFFALMLKVVYWRRKRLFVEHFIYSTHSHAFLVFVLLVCATMKWFFGFYPSWLVLFSIPYYYFSLKKVYGQSWKKTILKGTLLYFFYALFFLPTFLMVCGALTFLFF